MEPIVETKQLCFQTLQYQDQKIFPEQTTILSGKSGSGKTTLLRIWNATLQPTSGMCLYHGKPFSEWEPLVLRRNILLCRQKVFLFDGTIQENFMRFFDYREQALPSKQQMQQYLDICCVPFSLDTSCVHLSGGERQRVFLSIALSFLPELLLLDEPTAALDEKTAEVVLKQIKQFCKENRQALVIVTHQKQWHCLADQMICLGKEEKNE